MLILDDLKSKTNKQPKQSDSPSFCENYGVAMLSVHGREGCTVISSNSQARGVL